MTKEQVIKGCVKLIEKIAKEKGLEVINEGTGHAFDNSFWKDLASDTSNIPSVHAKGNGYSIALRPFWSSPEIDIRRETNEGEELLIFNYSDYVKQDGEYVHTEDFKLHEIRIDVHSVDYKAAIEEVYQMIDEVEREAN